MQLKMGVSDTRDAPFHCGNRWNKGWDAGLMVRKPKVGLSVRLFEGGPSIRKTFESSTCGFR